MAQIIIDIPDAKAIEIRDAFAFTFGWTAASGLTKIQFAKLQVAKYIKKIYQDHAATQASQAAFQTSQTETNQVIIT